MDLLFLCTYKLIYKTKGKKRLRKFFLQFAFLQQKENQRNYQKMIKMMFHFLWSLLFNSNELKAKNNVKIKEMYKIDLPSVLSVFSLSVSSSSKL